MAETNPLTLRMEEEARGRAVAPLFSAPPGTKPVGSINLDDIFADCFFSQDGEAAGRVGILVG